MIELILELMGKSKDDYELVKDRPGHDMRYAIDSSKLRDELGWKPKISFEQTMIDLLNWWRQIA